VTLLTDTRQAARSLGRRPGFVLALMMTVALGIGGNAVVLGFMNGLVTRRTPLVDDGRTIVSVLSRREDGRLGLLSYREYLTVKDHTSLFDSLAAARETRNTIQVGPNSAVTSVATVTPEALALLGLSPGEGVVLSHRFRENELSGVPDLAKQPVKVDDLVLPIAGVAPSRLEGLYLGRPVDAWIVSTEGSSLESDRDSETLSVIGRLRDGLSMREVRDSLDTLAVPGAAFVAHRYTGLAPEMQEGMMRLATLMASAAGAVFLIACANVAVFLLSRAATRSHDTSLRMALGATRGALAKAVLVDSALIAVAGGAAGLLLAMWTADVIPALLFESDAADMEFVPDTMAVVAAVAVSVIVTLGCGMVPLLENRHDTPGDVLRREPRRPSRSLRRLRGVLVVFQLSACCALVISAASLADMLNAALRTQAGERLGRPILATVESKRRFARADLGLEYFRRLDRTSSDVPGITSTAWTGTPPGAAPSWYAVKVEPPGLTTREVTATAGVFAPRSLERVVLPPKRGRMPGGRDTNSTCRVVVVNEAIAAELFEEDAVGRAMDDEAGQRVEIVGVVTPKRSSSSSAPNDEPAIYYYAEQGDLPFSQNARVKFKVPVLPPIGRGMLGLHVVSSNYFTLLGLSLRDGKLFTDGGSPDLCRVGVINEQAAEQYFAGNAVGGAVIDHRGQRTTIVGVVQDVRLRTIERRAEPAMYVPMTQDFLPRMHMILGSADASVELQHAVRSRLEAVDGGNPGALAVTSLDDQLRRTALAPERIATLLLGVASLNALAIGILGLQRVIAEDVLVRRKEIATRSALGAQRWRLIGMVVMHGTRLAAAGALFGVAGALLITRGMHNVTGFASSPIGWIWLAGPIVLAIGALVASMLPASRILAVAPLTAMRSE
jgi:putative ABC transport system permease protein